MLKIVYIYFVVLIKVPKVVLRCPTPQTDYYGIKFVWLRYEDAYADFCVSCRGSTVSLLYLGGLSHITKSTFLDIFDPTSPSCQ